MPDQPEELTAEAPDRPTTDGWIRLTIGWVCASVLFALLWWPVFESFFLIVWMLQLCVWGGLCFAGVGIGVVVIGRAEMRRKVWIWLSVAVATFCLWCPGVVGAHAKLLLLQGRYRNAIEAAFSGEQVSGVGTVSLCVPSVIVDTRDSPPVRAAITWFAAHGDWIGIVYDPTRIVGTDRESDESWLWGSTHRHLWGPWYFSGN